MCATCGCSDHDAVTVTALADGHARPAEMPAQHMHDHDHDHDHDNHAHGDHDHAHPHAHNHNRPHHEHEHGHAHQHGTLIALEQEVLARNSQLAERNRGWFEGRNILALNLVSSPGAGKTTLLERTIRDLHDEPVISVIEGDQATFNDAERIGGTGCKVVQINTGAGCHLDADMLARGLKQLAPPLDSVVMIENVGNLVCPALFDLGERAKVVILSVTEGDDKPVKYPHMFRASRLMILNKIDLLPHVSFDVERCIDYARRINPDIEVLQLSATTGEGMNDWYVWLRRQVAVDHVAEATP
ncbi:MAG: hydrogenase nickel incorporation protein HypB [Gammaproteobacteria bacterium]|nr:hydrogenase nickel incorporation protein HypB [Gammaproteobacteria bacterium]